MRTVALMALCAVFVVADFMVFKSGADSFFWSYKTAPELELQRRLIEKKGCPI